MHCRGLILTAMLIFFPLSARGADLVVWWEKGFYAQEDEAVREIIAAFGQKTLNKVELVFYTQEELPESIVMALDDGRPPDFASGQWFPQYIAQWALDDRLADLSDAVDPFSNLFDPDTLNRVVWLNASTGQKALYGLPVGRSTNHGHVWRSLLERAGFTLADIPREWEAFWSFWCDEVQPGVRQATGRDDIWVSGCQCQRMPMIPGCNSSTSWLPMMLTM